MHWMRLPRDKNRRRLSWIHLHGHPSRRLSGHYLVKNSGEIRMIYIQRRDQWQLETVDEFATMKEARAMLTEYRLSDPSAHYYTSSRPCNHWKE
jgi:hypothetical protein